MYFYFNFVLVREHTLKDSNLLKCNETCFMAHIQSDSVTVISVFEKNLYSVVVGYNVLKCQLSKGG